VTSALPGEPRTRRNQLASSRAVIREAIQGIQPTEASGR
jgi:hypothetical protein